MIRVNTKDRQTGSSAVALTSGVNHVSSVPASTGNVREFQSADHT